jgi:predicted secreted protein with PEFG-CTERM motif
MVDGSGDGTLTVTLHEDIIKPFDDGGFFVMVNGEEADFIQNGNNLMIPCDEGTERIEIYGSWAIPEFGVIAGVILAVAIASIIAVSAKSRLALVPKY